MNFVSILFKIFRGFGVLLAMLAIIHPLTACGSKTTMHDNPPSTDEFTRPGAAPSVPQPTETASGLSIPIYTYEVINSWPHDPDAFTQGLVFHEGKLYESTGHFGTSTLRKLDLKKNEILKKIPVSAECFAEGIAIYQGKIYQLTWTEHKAFVYDLKSFHLESELAYEGEGWGLTHDDHQLIMSDGTNQIRFVDPVTFKTTRTISVVENGVPVMELNELEYIKGEIYANVWKSDRIARIDPHDGRLLGWIDLTGLYPIADRPNSEDVLNGIAYDEKDDRLLVTGKRWPKIFEIRLKPKVSP